MSGSICCYGKGRFPYPHTDFIEMIGTDGDDRGWAGIREWLRSAGRAQGRVEDQRWPIWRAMLPVDDVVWVGSVRNSADAGGRAGPIFFGLPLPEACVRERGSLLRAGRLADVSALPMHIEPIVERLAGLSDIVREKARDGIDFGMLRSTAVPQISSPIAADARASRRERMRQVRLADVIGAIPCFQGDVRLFARFVFDLASACQMSMLRQLDHVHSVAIAIPLAVDHDPAAQVTAWLECLRESNLLPPLRHLSAVAWRLDDPARLIVLPRVAGSHDFLRFLDEEDGPLLPASAMRMAEGGLRLEGRERFMETVIRVLGRSDSTLTDLSDFVLGKA